MSGPPTPGHFLRGGKALSKAAGVEVREKVCEFSRHGAEKAAEFEAGCEKAALVRWCGRIPGHTVHPALKKGPWVSHLVPNLWN